MLKWFRNVSTYVCGCQNSESNEYTMKKICPNLKSLVIIPNQQQVNQSLRLQHSNPIYPLKILEQCPLIQFHSVCVHKPRYVQMLVNNWLAKPFYKSILTVLSVIFCLREAILSASIGDSSNSERSSTALSRSLEQKLAKSS